MKSKSELYMQARQLILDATGVLNVIKSREMDTNLFLILDHLDKAAHVCRMEANQAKEDQIFEENSND